jgi:hypothetical protein
MIRESLAFLAFSEDIRKRTFIDWMEAHISAAQPLHRYKGLLNLDRDKISFYGTEKKTGNDFRLFIYRHEIQQLYHGFDDVFTVLETRNLGLSWKPLRISFTRDKTDFRVYLIIDYAFGRTTNEAWMEALKSWLD